MTRHRRQLVLLAAATAVALYDGCGGGSSSSPPPAQSVSVRVSPATASVPVGATQQFSAVVSGTPDTQVTWSIQGAGTGNSTVGTISGAGLYTAPNTPPPSSVNIMATSQADSSASGSAAVTVIVPMPGLSSLSPIVTMANSAVKLTASGNGFAGTSQIVFNGRAIPTTAMSGQLTALLSATDVAQPGTYSVSVHTASKSSNSLSFYVVPAISPNAVAVAAGGTTSVPAIAVRQPKLSASSALSWVAIGTGTSGGVTPVTVKQGGTVNLFTVGQGFQAGVFFVVSGPGDVSITQPLVSNLGQTTDIPPIPTANVMLAVHSSAMAGARNVLVTNPAGEISVFPGGLTITQGP